MTDIEAEEADLIERVRKLESKMDDLPALQQQITSLLDGRKTTRWIIALVIPALVTALGTVLVWAASKMETAAERVGETTAELRAIRDKNAEQEVEISELRAQLWSIGRRSSAAPAPPTSIDLPPPDKFSEQDHCVGMLVDEVGGPLGGSNPHRPKLHLLQPCCGRSWHSALLEQVSPQIFGVIAGVGAGSLDDVQAAITINAMRTLIPNR